MEMYLHDDQLVHLEAALSHSMDDERVSLLVTVAWGLRQRDTERALLLGDEAKALMDNLALHRPAMQGRLHLLRAEARWLYAETREANRLANAALAIFVSAADWAGQADSHWLLGWIASDLGQPQQREQHWSQAHLAAQQALDTERAEIILAGGALMDALRDVNLAQQRWSSRFDAKSLGWPVPLWSWVANFWGVYFAFSNDFDQAAGYFTQAYEAALETGQLRRAISSSLNVGITFAKLSDYHSALDWMYRSLDLARTCGWPGSIGYALTHTSDILRRLDQIELANQFLQEALDSLHLLPGSRHYAVALQQLAELELDRGQAELALDLFTRLQARGEALGQSQFQIEAQRGQALALLQLERIEPALSCAKCALQLARAVRDQLAQIAACRTLAAIHLAHTLPPEAEAQHAASPALFYLQQAHELSVQIVGHTIPDDLQDAMADAYAAVGQHQAAFHHARAANLARQTMHHSDAARHGMAMQVRQHTDQIHAEAEHHRQLAAAEAQRAEILQQASANLAHLGAIGQEITAHLDEAAVFQVLNRHVHGLLDTNAFAVYLISGDGLFLERAFGLEAGKALPTARIAWLESELHAAICLRERRELVVDLGHASSQPLPGTLRNQSGLYAPLALGDRVLGVMGVQSMQTYAYGERQCLIFRTLCAYGAIALDNARAYRQLQEAQSRLVEQEKLAALGSLVAGVAHELNTPIGNSLIMASSLQDKTRTITLQLQQKALRRSDLELFLTESRESARLIQRGLANAADLINSFKQVAVDRTSAQRRRFNLQQTCHEISATLANHLKPGEHKIIQSIPDDIELISYPGPFGQVLINLINNAVLHAFDQKKGGVIRMEARSTTSGRVLFEFQDDGHGIPETHLKRIFDPFFTTKLGQGGSGLGLNISYNIITTLLGGQISVESEPGCGTRFMLDLPLHAPNNGHEA
jgi:signal transduction histidine kinase